MAPSRLPLTSAVVVCSSRPGLEDLAGAVSSFLDPCVSRWTLEHASENGHVRLLRRLVAQEAPSAPPQFREHQLRRALAAAVRFAAAADDDGDSSSSSPCERQVLEVLECLRAYHPTGSATCALHQAVTLGCTRVAQWLAANFANVDWCNLELAAAAAREGHVDALEWLKSAALCDEQHFADALEQAAGSGRLASVKWLLESGAVQLPCSAQQQHDVLCRAVSGGHHHVIVFLHDDAGFRFSAFKYFMVPIDRAASAGSLDVVLWLHEHGFTQFSRSALFSAVKDGSTEIVRWLLANASEPLVDGNLCLLAVASGDIEILQMLQDIHPGKLPWLNSGTIVEAASRGQLELLQWLYQTLRASHPDSDDGYGYSTAIFLAARNGHFEVVQWLFRNARVFTPTRGSFEEKAVSDAAGNGHGDIARWLHAQLSATCSWRPRYDLTLASMNGHLHLVKWLVEVSGTVTMTSLLHDEVAASGHLETLQYIARMPHSLTDFAMDMAAEGNHLDTVKWLYTERGIRGLKAMDNAAKRNHLRVVKWLHAHTDVGCSTAAMNSVASLEMVQWLHENRSEGCTTAAMDTAAKLGDFDTLLFLHENRREGCSADAVVSAHTNGHEEIYEWLCETYPHVAESEDAKKGMRLAAYRRDVAALFYGQGESKRQRTRQ